MKVYRNNLKDRESGKESPQYSHLDPATIAKRQGASENATVEASSALPEPSSSSRFAIAAEPDDTLTPYPTGSLKELAYLALPLILSLFSTSFMGFCDRLFLAHYSLEALEASVSAGYLCNLFQHPIIRIATMAQVFVGFYKGAKSNGQIGECIWQMIWLSFLSMIITLPTAHFVAPLFFKGTAIKASASTYFFTLMGFNFLFPLGASLTSYFIARAKTRTIFLATLIAHLVNLGLDPLLIFGIEGVFPSLGILGAAIATGVAQTIFCIVLFFAFLRKADRKECRTGDYQFKWPVFRNQLQVALPRAITRIILTTAWAATARVMTLKGGDYLMVLSVGGTLILLFTFINDGMGQAIITIASNVLGSKNYERIWILVRCSLIFLVTTTLLLAIPHLFFSRFMLSFFFSELPRPETLKILQHSCIWLWLFFFAYGLNTIGMSLITASRDVVFYTFSILFVWMTSYFPVYFGINYLHWSPDKFWLVMVLDSFLFALVFLMRASKEKWKSSSSTTLFKTAAK